MAGERTKDGLIPEKNAVRAVVRDALVTKGWTYQDLADKIGISGTALSRFMNTNNWLSFAHLIKLTEVLGITLTDLFARVGSEKNGKTINPFEVDEDAVKKFCSGGKPVGRPITTRDFHDWFSEITPLERVIVTSRHLAIPTARLEELAGYTGLSRQRVSQIEKEAISKI